MIGDWIESGLAAATSDECIVIVRDSTEANLRWAINMLTTNGQMHHRSATVIAIRRVDGVGHAGVVSAPVASEDDLVALVGDACAACASAPASDDSAPLPDPVVDADYADGAVATSIDVFATFAEGLGRALEASRHAGTEMFGYAEHHSSTVWLATSAGARRRAVERWGKVELNAKHADRIGSAWVGRSTTDFTDVDADALADEVTHRLAWCENRVELPAGRYETILPPSAVADLMILTYWSASGRDAEQGRTVFAGPRAGTTRVGETLSGLPLTLTSGPGVLPAPSFAVVEGSAPGLASVYDNGAPADTVSWLRDGTLSTLPYTRAGAAASQVPYAFPSENLVLDAGSSLTLDEMVRSTTRGLLLTCLWYIREVDIASLLVTGLTRDGVYLVENGEVVGMVNNFRFNESPVDLLRRAVEASATEPTLCREWNDWFTFTSMPALRVPDFNMSTVSKAY
ncbi:MAG TPA: metallopeptidase TldD-related protein [Propionibacteriaceae bacterium]|nr:metallopeptidase TldD-related protein [Propionibacteriaceae bacterium]